MQLGQRKRKGGKARIVDDVDAFRSGIVAVPVRLAVYRFGRRRYVESLNRVASGRNNLSRSSLGMHGPFPGRGCCDREIFRNQGAWRSIVKVNGYRKTFSGRNGRRRCCGLESDTEREIDSVRALLPFFTQHGWNLTETGGAGDSIAREVAFGFLQFVQRRE